MEIVYAYAAEQAEKGGILFDISPLAYRVGFSEKTKIRVTLGILQAVSTDLDIDLGRTINNLNSQAESAFTDDAKHNEQVIIGFERLAEILTGILTDIENSANRDGEYFPKLNYINPDGEKIKVWGVMDNTSGTAIHIMTAEEY